MTHKTPSLSIFLAIARDAVAAQLRRESYSPPVVPAEINAPQGVFVTIYDFEKNLRGCIGHITPFCKTLAEEVAECACAAAFADPRFPPINLHEFDTVRFEISLLGPLSPAESIAQLDAKRFGVVVSSGFKRGLLLPDLDGVDTVEMQIDIARRKAGIGRHEAITIQKFEIERIAH
jgi:AmmeMemoRadiSam system protein A